MAKIKIYGSARSRTSHVLWAARELGLDFEHVDVDQFKGETRRPEFLAINPNGKIPALVDGDLTLFESLAINLYLAKKHGRGGEAPLYPAGEEVDALIVQWTIWAQAEIEASCVNVLMERVMKPEGVRSAAVADAAEKSLQAPLGVLDKVLAGRPYLVADHFTIADLNVATVLSVLGMAGVGLSAFPNVEAWLGRCLGRPAAHG